MGDVLRWPEERFKWRFTLRRAARRRVFRPELTDGPNVVRLHVPTRRPFSACGSMQLVLPFPRPPHGWQMREERFAALVEQARTLLAPPAPPPHLRLVDTEPEPLPPEPLLPLPPLREGRALDPDLLWRNALAAMEERIRHWPPP